MRWLYTVHSRLAVCWWIALPDEGKAAIISAGLHPPYVSSVEMRASPRCLICPANQGRGAEGACNSATTLVGDCLLIKRVLEWNITFSVSIKSTRAYIMHFKALLHKEPFEFTWGCCCMTLKLAQCDCSSELSVWSQNT